MTGLGILKFIGFIILFGLVLHYLEKVIKYIITYVKKKFKNTEQINNQLSQEAQFNKKIREIVNQTNNKDGFTWEEYITKYKNKTINVTVERSTAMTVLKDKYILYLMSKSRKYAHLFWLNVSGLLLFSFIVTLFLYFFMEGFPLWYPIGALAGSVILNLNTQQTACEFIIEEALENESFYYELNKLGFPILKIQEL